MRFKIVVWALLFVLLVESPALAKMHADSPPTIRSFIFILIWVAVMTWLFRAYYGAGRVSLAFGIGTVTAAVVLGEYVDALLRVYLKAGAHDILPLGWVLPCVCAVSLLTQAAAALWSGRMQGAQPITLGQVIRVPWFWVIGVLPAGYVLLKEVLPK